MNSLRHAGHLARRFVTSLSRREPAEADTAWAGSHLLEAESQLWHRMSAADRRHSITVARRFAANGSWSREEMAGALLHDVGKIDADLSTATRIAATIVGPRTARFRRYHDHERIGAELLTHAGSSPVTVGLVEGHGPAASALKAADNI